MNTKHFLTAAFLGIGLLLTTINADAQRNYDRGNRDRDNYQQRGPRSRDHVRGHRHGRPVVVFHPPVRHRRYVRRHVPCAPVAYCQPPRRGHHHRWHR